MNNKLLLILFLLSLSSTYFAQKITAPKVALSSVPTELIFSDFPPEADTLEVTLSSGENSILHRVILSNGSGIANIEFNSSGNYAISTSNFETETNITIIPGWLSVVPPLIAILLALLIRQVIVALIAGIYAGALFLNGFNPFTALLRLADEFIMNSVVNKDHMFIILFTLLIGGVVGVISKNGGTVGLAKQITKFARTPRSGMLSSWLMGVLIFFDDYANSLIIGNMMRPITDRLKISREKLAYIVDSTAAPIASIVLISTWIGYEVGLIGDGLKVIGSDKNAYDVFISSIPFAFYPIAAILFVFLVSYMQRDFGPMFKAEKYVRETGDVEKSGDSASKLEEHENSYNGSSPKWINGFVPILIILVGTMIGLYFTGIASIDALGDSNYSIQNIINHSDSYSSLLWASFIASVVAILMSVIQKDLNLKQSIAAWEKGIQSMMVAALILVFAWAISKVTADLHTADYLISILSDSLHATYLPVLIFILCAVIGFSTGTSWGTMAIVMPIIIPLSHKISLESGITPEHANQILYSGISAVLAGSVFGDHCSPIADTTILSSLASRCNHIEHVNTQLPYAITVGVVTIIFGYIPIGFEMSPYLALAIITIVLFLILKFIGKKV